MKRYFGSEEHHKDNYKIYRNLRIVWANIIFTISLWVAYLITLIHNFTDPSLYLWGGLSIFFGVLIYGKCIYDIKKNKK